MEGAGGSSQEPGVWFQLYAAQHKAHHHTASAHQVCHGCYSQSPTPLRWPTPTLPCTTSSQADYETWQADGPHSNPGNDWAKSPIFM